MSHASLLQVLNAGAGAAQPFIDRETERLKERNDNRLKLDMANYTSYMENKLRDTPYTGEGEDAYITRLQKEAGDWFDTGEADLRNAPAYYREARGRMKEQALAGARKAALEKVDEWDVEQTDAHTRTTAANVVASQTMSLQEQMDTLNACAQERLGRGLGAKDQVKFWQDFIPPLVSARAEALLKSTTTGTIAEAAQQAATEIAELLPGYERERGLTAAEQTRLDELNARIAAGAVQYSREEITAAEKKKAALEEKKAALKESKAAQEKMVSEIEAWEENRAKARTLDEDHMKGNISRERFVREKENLDAQLNGMNMDSEELERVTKIIEESEGKSSADELAAAKAERDTLAGMAKERVKRPLVPFDEGKFVEALVQGKYGEYFTNEYAQFNRLIANNKIREAITLGERAGKELTERYNTRNAEKYGQLNDEQRLKMDGWFKVNHLRAMLEGGKPDAPPGKVEEFVTGMENYAIFPEAVMRSWLNGETPFIYLTGEDEKPVKTFVRSTEMTPRQLLTNYIDREKRIFYLEKQQDKMPEGQIDNLWAEEVYKRLDTFNTALMKALPAEWKAEYEKISKLKVDQILNTYKNSDFIKKNKKDTEFMEGHVQRTIEFARDNLFNRPLNRQSLREWKKLTQDFASGECFKAITYKNTTNAQGNLERLSALDRALRENGAGEHVVYTNEREETVWASPAAKEAAEALDQDSQKTLESVFPQFSQKIVPKLMATDDNDVIGKNYYTVSYEGPIEGRGKKTLSVVVDRDDDGTRRVVAYDPKTGERGKTIETIVAPETLSRFIASNIRSNDPPLYAGNLYHYRNGGYAIQEGGASSREYYINKKIIFEVPPKGTSYAEWKQKSDLEKQRAWSAVYARATGGGR
jgi:hypothetical protein